MQKDQRAHTMATHRRPHINQTVFSNTPHERGGLGKPTVLLDSLGIIPACAGNTPVRPGRSRTGRDHLRMRGEHMADAYKGLHIRGSSPYTRGALRKASFPSFLCGIIPACAGSTWCRRPPSPLRRDHPRMRGEHEAPLLRAAAGLGSSPHARRARFESLAAHSRSGIIPACAGSTPCSWSAPWWWRDHPRMRGEHRKQDVLDCFRGDHPRMRGEHSMFLWIALSSQGSSPHARGARLGLVDLPRWDGIIPACAESTRSAPRGWCRCRDHPRMRGEHCASATRPSGPTGSSRHARGALVSALG